MPRGYAVSKLIPLLLLICSILSHVVDASIEVIDFGRTYQSRPDKYIGLQLRAGVEYSARLQRISGDQYLCGDNQSNVTVPKDGLPIALVVKKGFCSFAQKAEYASRNIYPPGIVKVLIIYGGIRFKDDEEDNGDYGEESEIKYSKLFKPKQTTEQLPLFFENTDTLNQEDEITVALLHISYQVGYDLEIILNEETDVQNVGGMLVKLDGISPAASRVTVVIWVALSFLIFSILCCCISNTISDFLEEEPEPEPHRRPRRLRLTAEQVKKVPIGIFDGNQLIYETSTCSDSEMGDHDNIFQPSSHSLDACTICLDEYGVGDKLRCLPCSHAFHAKCITKWLIERSATCPLCKIDLYEEEDDDDDDDDNEDEGEVEQQRNQQQQQEQGLSSSWDSVPREALALPITTVDSIEGSWWGRIWSTRIFTSLRQLRRIDTVTSEALSEPLLQQHEEVYNNTTASVNTNDQQTPISDDISTAISSTVDGGSSSL